MLDGWFAAMNEVLKFTILVLTALILNGAVFHGTGSQLFYLTTDLTAPPTYLHIDSYGIDQRIHYKCQGADEGSSPTPVMIVEGSMSDAVSDYSGLLHALSDESGGRQRVCGVDKPGSGRSDPMRAGQLVAGPMSYYPDIMEALAKANPAYPPPYIFVG